MRKILILFMFATLMSLTSCGSRKVNKTNISESETIKKDSSAVKSSVVDLNSKTTVLRTENSKDSTIVETVEITPIDATKPAYFNNNGKVELVTNANFKKSRIIKTGSSNKSSSEISESELNKKYVSDVDLKTSATSEKKQSEKEVDRESWSMWNLLWLLIPVGLYLAYRYFKDKVWWV